VPRLDRHPAPPPAGSPHGISKAEFSEFRSFIHEATGISLSHGKEPLVAIRLAKRLHARGAATFGDYLQLLSGEGSAAEVQIAIDLLTTNETSFFREPPHFELLRQLAVEARTHHKTLRTWSAACSSGEEAYSMAMVLEDCLGGTAWEVFGSDISSRMLAAARNAHYPDVRAKLIPGPYLKKFCLKGVGKYAGTVLIEKGLRSRVRFAHQSLIAGPMGPGDWDVIFVRNVMIYFDTATKREVTGRLTSLLAPGGTLCVGHSETLNGLTDVLEQVSPSIYRKPRRRRHA
jgi:chemotaxis protein methyltransferase CheR